MCGLDLDGVTCPEDGVHTVPCDVVAMHSEVELRGRVLARRFRILDLLGEGSMGSVYEAVQTSVGRHVAVKTLHTGGMRTREDVMRFFREARAASAMRSPHVVRILDFGFDDDTLTPFIAMELLVGQTLAVVLKRDGPMSLARAAPLLGGVAEALAEAESLGVVHRDLKPENIMIGLSAAGVEHAKVTDFGVAKLLNDAMKLTMSGAWLGTPSYIPPEQIAEGRVDRRSDLYALGCVMHTMLTGSPPFEAADVLKLLQLHLSQAPPALPDPLPSGEAVPAAIAELHQALLAKDPQTRPDSASLAREIFREVARVPKKSGWPLLMPLVLLALALTGGGCALGGAALLWLALQSG